MKTFPALALIVASLLPLASHAVSPTFTVTITGTQTVVTGGLSGKITTIPLDVKHLVKSFGLNQGAKPDYELVLDGSVSKLVFRGIHASAMLPDIEVLDLFTGSLADVETLKGGFSLDTVDAAPGLGSTILGNFQGNSLTTITPPKGAKPAKLIVSIVASGADTRPDMAGNPAILNFKIKTGKVFTQLP
jgi:hypothetical protein